MSILTGLTREQLRAQYVDAWRRGRAGEILQPHDKMICDVIELHHEYHYLLEEKGRALDYEPESTAAVQNPFLHMGLHLAVREQVSIDRPPGIRDLANRLKARFGAHDGEHALMQALGEILWDAQTARRQPDEQVYMNKARRLLEG